MLQALNQSSIVKEALREGIARLQQAKIDSASLDARILLAHALGLTREQLLLALDDAITAKQLIDYYALIARRSKHEPVSHLIGKREFWGMVFTVSAATLDPRADSETLIDAILARFPDRKQKLRILDLGTGTGCLLLALLSEFENATGLGIDQSADALRVADENALRHGLRARVAFQPGNWCEGVGGTFDIIVSNPPYIPSATIETLAPEVAQFEPKLALDGGEDGLDCYRAITRQLPTMLSENGIAAFEIGAGQQASVEALIKDSGMDAAGSREDLQGIVRCILIQHPIHNKKV